MMRTTIFAVLGLLALAGCDRTNATTSTTETRSATMPAPTAVVTPDEAALRKSPPNEIIRSEAGRAVDSAHVMLGPVEQRDAGP